MTRSPLKVPHLLIPSPCVLVFNICIFTEGQAQTFSFQQTQSGFNINALSLFHYRHKIKCMADIPSPHTVFLNQCKSERIISNNVTCISVTNAWIQPHPDVMMTVRCYVFTKKHYEYMIINTDQFSWAVLAACIAWRYCHWWQNFWKWWMTLVKVPKKLNSTIPCFTWSSLFSSLVMPTLCDPTDCSMPGFLVLHSLPEFVQTHVHWVEDAIRPSHPLLPTSPQDCFIVGTVNVY